MIGSANEHWGYVNVYNENGSKLFMKPGELIGYTSTTVTIKHNNYAETYNEKGSKLSMKPC